MDYNVANEIVIQQTVLYLVTNTEFLYTITTIQYHTI